MDANEHELKCWPEFYGKIESGIKNFEIRLNDRRFQEGDTLLIREYVPEKKRYTGRECRREISYMTDFEQKPGYVVLALKGLAAEGRQAHSMSEYRRITAQGGKIKPPNEARQMPKGASQGPSVEHPPATEATLGSTSAVASPPRHPRPAAAKGEPVAWEFTAEAILRKRGTEWPDFMAPQRLFKPGDVLYAAPAQEQSQAGAVAEHAENCKRYGCAEAGCKAFWSAQPVAWQIISPSGQVEHLLGQLPEPDVDVFGLGYTAVPLYTKAAEPGGWVRKGEGNE